jgi:hypothetical protein
MLSIYECVCAVRELEDTKGLIRSHNRTDKTMAKIKGTKGQTMIYKTIHIWFFSKKIF